jgi:hypothetical protein
MGFKSIEYSDGSFVTMCEYHLLKISSQGDSLWCISTDWPKTDFKETDDSGFIFVGFDGGRYCADKIYLTKLISEPNEIIDFAQKLPANYRLVQNFPNPFNPNTKITYQIPELSFVTLKIYDALGNEIIKLVNGEKPVGSYKIEFDATTLPSGIYFYRLQAGNFVENKKMILLK